ncbi:MAG: MoaD/ThiS family protein [Archaeoglobaceae archaeon]
MKVKLKFFATLREKFGKELEVECDGTLEGAFRAAAEKIGEDFLREVFDDSGKLRDDRIILVNGRNVKDEEPKLEEGATIAIFPPVAGG